MNVSLYQAASAMSAHARWQELVTENLASASVPGFKKQALSFSAVEAALGSRGVTAPLLTRTQSATSFAQGEIRRTGVNTDVAVDGPGFFVAQLPNGATAYTRDGEFQISAQGELITKQGWPVLGASGPIQIDRNNPAPISISTSGEVSQGPETRGRLRLAEFEDPQRLQPIGGGAFLADPSGAPPAEVAQPSLRQGFLENANTSSVLEMANLIRVMRGFEANQRLLQAQDDRMGKAISELGSPN